MSPSAPSILNFSSGVPTVASNIVNTDAALNVTLPSTSNVPVVDVSPVVLTTNVSFTFIPPSKLDSASTVSVLAVSIAPDAATVKLAPLISIPVFELISPVAVRLLLICVAPATVNNSPILTFFETPTPPAIINAPVISDVAFVLLLTVITPSVTTSPVSASTVNTVAALSLINVMSAVLPVIVNGPSVLIVVPVSVFIVMALIVPPSTLSPLI